ncbi:MAG: metallophosphoesterase [Bryobacteraceae bacterium]
MINLLHLTDLHFGCDPDATARAERARALDLLAKVLDGLEPDWKPHVLAISRDLTWKGQPDGYKELACWLKNKLFAATGLTTNDCVVCPGNHDLDRKKARSLLDRTTEATRADEVLRPEELEDGFARPFHGVVTFAKDFAVPAPELHGKPNYLAGCATSKGSGLCA